MGGAVSRQPRIEARRIVQIVFLVLVLVIGAQFSLWAFAHLAGRAPGVAGRRASRGSCRSRP